MCDRVAGMKDLKDSPELKHAKGLLEEIFSTGIDCSESTVEKLQSCHSDLMAVSPFTNMSSSEGKEMEAVPMWLLSATAKIEKALEELGKQDAPSATLLIEEVRRKIDLELGLQPKTIQS
jgi:hypothetical protein